jgi:hypothetical protein
VVLIVVMNSFIDILPDTCPGALAGSITPTNAMTPNNELATETTPIKNLLSTVKEVTSPESAKEKPPTKERKHSHSDKCPSDAPNSDLSEDQKRGEKSPILSALEDSVERGGRHGRTSEPAMGSVSEPDSPGMIYLKTVSAELQTKMNS